jgi:tetratricopeptide (TPR) repeat protein
LSSNRLADARAHYERQLAIAREIGYRQGEAAATVNLGIVFHSQGRLANAREQFERGIACCREIGHRAFEANALHSLGTVLSDEGDVASAKVRLHAALELGEQIGFRYVAAATRLTLGALHSESGEETAAREWLTKSRDESSKLGFVGIETSAQCHLACVPGGDVKDAERCFSSNEERLSAGERLSARWLLWKATADRTHLAEAKRLLDEAVTNVPDDIRESMLANVRLNREIAAAAKAAGL